MGSEVCIRDRIGIAVHDTTLRTTIANLGMTDVNFPAPVFHGDSIRVVTTVEAVREQFPDRQLVACMELHTYSSLSENFLDQYAGCMDAADRAIVFYDPHAVQLKRLPPIPPERIQRAFGRALEVYSDPISIMGGVRKDQKERSVLLMMSSGNFGGMDLQAMSEAFIA